MSYRYFRFHDAILCMEGTVIKNKRNKWINNIQLIWLQNPAILKKSPCTNIEYIERENGKFCQIHVSCIFKGYNDLTS